MSVNIATMGMFRDCCGGLGGGGGAPPYHLDEVRVAPVVFVKNLEIEDIKVIKKIEVTLVDTTMED